MAESLLCNWTNKAFLLDRIVSFRPAFVCVKVKKKRIDGNNYDEKEWFEHLAFLTFLQKDH